MDKPFAFFFYADIANHGMQHELRVFQLQRIEFVIVSSAGCHFCTSFDQYSNQGFSDSIASTGYDYYFIVVKRHDFSDGAKLGEEKNSATSILEYLIRFHSFINRME